jgi:hypothetical protein
MIQLRTLALLLVAGFSSSVCAQASNLGPPAVMTAPKTQQIKTEKPTSQYKKNPVRYAWDRVGKPVGNEGYFV